MKCDLPVGLSNTGRPDLWPERKDRDRTADNQIHHYACFYVGSPTTMVIMIAYYAPSFGMLVNRSGLVSC